MPRPHSTSLFFGATAAAGILAILAVMYLVGDGPFDPGRHVKHAVLFFALAAGALIIANFNRPLGIAG